MRMYPELTGPRTKQVMADLSVFALLVICALLAWVVRSVILTLRVISDAMTSISDGIHGTWSSAADIFGAIPVVGNGIENLLQGLADGTIGNAADLSRSVSAAITLTANVAGAVTVLIPVALLAVLWLPGRIRRAQRWDAASRVLGLLNPHAITAAGANPPLPGQAGPGAIGAAPPELDPRLPADRETVVIASAPPAHLIAMRALCVMPFEDLVKFEPRPFEAYAAGQYDGLVTALYAYEGLRRVA